MTAEAFSPPYAAPEHLLDNRYGPASEVWGFGAMLYELLTGKPPFPLGRSESLVAFAQRVATEPTDTAPLENLLAPLRDLVGHCLAKSRDERPTVARLAAELTHLRSSLGWPVERPPLSF